MKSLDPARERLVAILRDIAEIAKDRSSTRCPYRNAADVCTFRGVCRNRFRPTGGKPVCTGGRLNPRAARADELTAALEAADVASATHPGGDRVACEGAGA